MDELNRLRSAMVTPGTYGGRLSAQVNKFHTRNHEPESNSQDWKLAANRSEHCAIATLSL